MDLATIIGLVLGSLLILASILLGGEPIVFVNIPSLLIVVGGTIAVLVIPLATLIGHGTYLYFHYVAPSGG